MLYSKAPIEKAREEEREKYAFKSARARAGNNPPGRGRPAPPPAGRPLLCVVTQGRRVLTRADGCLSAENRARLDDLYKDDRLLVLASASTHEHGFVGPWSSLLTYGLRKDGFVSLSESESAAAASLWKARAQPPQPSDSPL